jgi:hypothetical protein
MSIPNQPNVEGWNLKKNVKLKKGPKNYSSQLELTCKTHDLGHKIEMTL